MEQLKKINFDFEAIPFIFKNPEFLIIIEEAKKEVVKYFKNAILNFSLYKDIEENYEVLNLIILSNLPIEDLLKKETELFDNWFEKHYIDFKGKITLRVYPIS